MKETNMGCDIHLYVERLTDDGWKVLRPRSVGRASERDGDGGWWSFRQYELFAILANMRNEEGIEPIALPRGLPDDVSERVAKASAEWGIDGHGHSWLMVSEVLAYDWSEVTDRSMVERWHLMLHQIAVAVGSHHARLVFWFDN